jgi:hypothetical protein
VTDSGGGIPFDADDPLSLADAVQGLLRASPREHRQLRERLRRFYRENFAPALLLERYSRIFSPVRRARMGATIEGT